VRRARDLADFPQATLQRQLVESGNGQGEQQGNPVLKISEREIEGTLLLDQGNLLKRPNCLNGPVVSDS